MYQVSKNNSNKICARLFSTGNYENYTKKLK